VEHVQAPDVRLAPLTATSADVEDRRIRVADSLTFPQRYSARSAFARLRDKLDPDALPAGRTLLSMVRQCEDVPARRDALLEVATAYLDIASEPNEAITLLGELEADPLLEACGEHFRAKIHHTFGRALLALGRDTEAYHRLGLGAELARRCFQWANWATCAYLQGVAAVHANMQDEATEALAAVVERADVVVDRDLLIQAHLRLAILFILQRKLWLANGVVGSATELLRGHQAWPESTQAILMDLSRTVADQREAITQLTKHVDVLESAVTTVSNSPPPPHER
jgi:hypothetical protein